MLLLQLPVHSSENNGMHYQTLFLPRFASAEDSEAAGELLAGDAAAPAAAEGCGGLEVIRGVTTAGEPGPRSMRLSSEASSNTWV